MLFSARLPMASLIELSRALRHNLAAGLTLVKVFRQQAVRGSIAVRPVAERIAQDLQRGHSLEDALEREQAAFPPLFLALASMGEHSGYLPEVFGELEKYYLLQQRLWRRFLSQIAWPVFQFVAATLVIAGLILILDILGATTKDPLSIGLTGAAGAIRFLLSVYGCLALLVVAYLLASRSLRHKAAIDGLLLRLPAIGPCLMALAMMRFCLALRLTLETGMPITDALALSLRATGNAAFVVRTEAVQSSLRSGDDLTLALTRGGLFPEVFLNIVAVAEEGGRVPEIMRHQADYYEEEANIRLAVLTRAAGWLVYVAVAGMIIWAIFRILTTMILPHYSNIR